jgi:hypothetical protein
MRGDRRRAESRSVPVARQDVVITVTGELDDRLRREFEDLEITVDHSVTHLRASADTSMLHGVLHRIESLGLELLDVHQLDAGSPDPW